MGTSVKHLLRAFSRKWALLVGHPSFRRWVGATLSLLFIVWILLRLRKASRRQETLRKARAAAALAAAASSSSSSAAAADPGSLGAAVVEAIGPVQFSQPASAVRPPSAALTLSQRYLEGLGGEKHRICIGLRCIAEADDPQGALRIFTEALGVVRKLTGHHHLVLVHQVASDADAEKAQAAIAASGLKEDGFKDHHLVLCDTARGKAAIVRQLAPQLYFDHDVAALTEMSAFLPSVVYVGPPLGGTSALPSSVASCASLQQYFQ